MNCPNCGTSNLDTASICANCGRPLSMPPPQPPPQPPAHSYTPPPPPQMAGSYAPSSPASVPNYLVPSIIVTLCCCLPFGIVAIVYAAQVNSKLAAGDIAGAMQASRSARMWCLIAALTGIIVSVLWIVLAGGSAFLEGVRQGMGS